MSYLAGSMFRLALFAAAYASAAPAQDPTADASRPLPGLRIPIHTAPDDLGTPYGIWAAADSYKASFHGDMTFVPYSATSTRTTSRGPGAPRRPRWATPS
jgi:hypothetical protein